MSDNIPTGPPAPAQKADVFDRLKFAFVGLLVIGGVSFFLSGGGSGITLVSAFQEKVSHDPSGWIIVSRLTGQKIRNATEADMRARHAEDMLKMVFADGLFLVAALIGLVIFLAAVWPTQNRLLLWLARQR